jgi:glycosyltransferase involved in cell wall biosynthesis
VPHAVDTSAFDVKAPDTILRERLGLRPHVIAYVGRLVEEKGVRVLLEAYRRLPRRESTSLLCVGGGPLAKLSRAEPGVIVVDGVQHSDVPQYLACADLVVLPSLTTPSWKEQLGRVVLEAMACGLPVIGSDSGEIPNLINETGGGVVVPEGKAAALSGALAWLIEDPAAARELGDRGRAAVRARYSVRAVATRLAKALELESPKGKAA